MTCKTCGGDAKDRAFCAACLARPNPYEGSGEHSSVRSKRSSINTTFVKQLEDWGAPPDTPTRPELREAGIIDLKHIGWRYGRYK